GMNGVPAKVAQEVAMLLQDEDVHPGPCQQVAQHHPGGTSAGDAAADIHSRRPETVAFLHVPNLPLPRAGSRDRLKDTHPAAKINHAASLSRRGDGSACDTCSRPWCRTSPACWLISPACWRRAASTSTAWPSAKPRTRTCRA